MKLKWILTSIVITVMIAGSGCSKQPKEVPMETYVKIWFKVFSDDAFMKKHQSPAEASNDELEPFTKPFNYSPDDFKFTYKQINSNPDLKKKFDDLSLQYLSEKSSSTLREGESIRNADTTKTATP
jgi:hypothetical protein